MNKKTKTTFTIIAIILIVGIVGGYSYLNNKAQQHGAFSINDNDIFLESPKIVTEDGKYSIEFRYGDKAFFFLIHSKIADDKLVFYLPVTSSSGNPAGKLSSKEITDPKEIELIEKGMGFWEEPDKTLIKLKVQKMEEK